MQVETYEATVEQHPEACEEARALIESLGLEGAKSKEPADARNPYRRMMENERRIYSLLCPTKDDVKQYDADSIPLRVLQVLAHATQLGVYEGFEVWHAADSSVKDPILVAYLPSERWSNKRYLLARWGAELDDLPALALRAAGIAKQRALHSLNELKLQVEAKLASLKATADNDPALLQFKTFTTYDQEL